MVTTIFLVGFMGCGKTTLGEALARVMRHELRKRGIRSLLTVCSTELPKEGPLSPDGRRKPGSSAFVPPAAGLLLASAVVRELTGAAGRR